MKDVDLIGRVERNYEDGIVFKEILLDTLFLSNGD